jgi:hypothetical protein
MHLRSNKNSLSKSSVKVHKKTIRKNPVKNNLVKELKSGTEDFDKGTFSIEGQQMDLSKMIRIYNECIIFLQKEYILKNQEKEDASRILNTIELTDFETMSFVCPELNFWKHQF